jgi:LysM repeat protein
MSLFKKTTIAKGFWLYSKKSYSLLIMSLIILPSVSQAGILDFISSGLSRKALAEEVSTIQINSSNIALLEPANSPDPKAKIVTDVTIVGNEALLPEVGPSTLAPDKVDNSFGQISVYTVREGDTLSGIGKMYDVSVNTILWANDLTRSSAIRPGQNLIILPMSGIMHGIVKGDTLQSVAKRYGGDVEEIALFNDMKVTDTLVVGNTLMIPDGEMSFSTRPSAAPTSGQTARLVNSSGGPDLSGYYQKPFSVGRRTQGLHGYNGVDYGMPIGTPIYASAPGNVIISKNSGYNGGYGSYIVIQHPNKTQTVYAHLSTTQVTVGQSVTRGQTIGLSGNTGKSTGPHLHFEVRGAKNPF